ncbi:MAG TPA: hypothetical protein VGD67_20345 [Pseudonocardiaceae bacterium]
MLLAHAPRLPRPLRGLTAELVTVVPDPALADSTGVLRAELADGSALSVTGDGDTAHWGLADVLRHYRDEVPAAAEALACAVSELSGAPDVAQLGSAWRDSVTEWSGTG